MNDAFLDGQVAIVNAAGGGFGTAVAGGLARRGARVVLQDLPSAEPAVSASIARIAETGGDAVSCFADATNPDEAPKPAALALETWGRVDVLVNLVGGSVGPVKCPVWEQTIDDWVATLDRNLTATFRATQAVLPTMMERRSGKIVNTASTAWAGHPGNAAYSAAKAAVVSFTRTLSQQLAPYDINVNAVAPGISRTGFFQRMGFDEAGVPESFTSAIPLGRVNEPDDVAGTILFLLSPTARNISGQLITVAGGQNPSL